MDQLKTSPFQRRFFHGRLNLEQQKKQAKELLKALQRGDKDALQRFELICHDEERASYQLTDAQRILAREQGFSSWPRLKAYCDQMELAKKKVQDGRLIDLDSVSTRHIRCGSDIEHALRVSGFVGEFLEFSDPFCQGPLSSEPDTLRKLRDAFISDAYGVPLPSVRKRQDRSYKALSTLDGIESIVLWFEHDAYDQCILMYLLHTLQDSEVPLELICVDSVPGVPDFVGLGHLAPETLLWLWENERVPVTQELCSLCSLVWRAFASAQVKDLWSLLPEMERVFPILAAAMTRHFQELAATSNACSLTEQLSLKILQERGPLKAKDLFKILTREYEPLPYLGDAMYWHALKPLLDEKRPLIAFHGQSQEAFAETMLMITDRGRRVFSAQEQAEASPHYPRWFGGYKVFDGPYRWDDRHQTLIY